MQQQKSMWAWLKETTSMRTMFSHPVQKTIEEHDHRAVDDDNPWLTLREKRMADNAQPPYIGKQANPSSRWVRQSAAPSLYGFADEDGTMRQVDSSTWQAPFTQSTANNSSRRFVPKRASRGSVPQTPARPNTSSPWMWQTICAAALVVGGLYVHHGQTAIAQKISGVYSYTFATDYTSQTWPVVDRFLVNHHIALPAFGLTSSISVHIPMSGNIVQDYNKTNHPEIWIQGTATEAVLAAGSGVVKQIQTSTGNEMMEIDAGGIGTMIYAGLGSVSVKTGESVYAGEIIGRLPATPQTPQLRFSMTKDGQFENPHDFIHFAQSGV